MSDQSKAQLLEQIQLLASQVSSSSSLASASLAQQILQTTRNLPARHPHTEPELETAIEHEKEALERAEEAKATMDTAIEQGKQFINEKKSVLTAAFEAGKEAMKKEQRR